jgi:hypothetical protein
MVSVILLRNTAHFGNEKLKTKFHRPPKFIYVQDTEQLLPNMMFKKQYLECVYLHFFTIKIFTFLNSYQMNQKVPDRVTGLPVLMCR